MTPPVITSLSSTGTGKTTLMVHLAYLIAKNGLSVALIELDNNNSFRDCCGLPNPIKEESTAAILADGFDGNYPFIPLWSEHLQEKAVVIQAERESLDSIARQLTGDAFGVFRLRERLQEIPIECDVILIDAPGHQGQLSSVALCAATHLILTVEMTQKCISDIDAFFQELYKKQRYLGSLPEVIGIVPGRYNHNIAMQRNTMAQFPNLAQKLETQCFAPIRHSAEFLNAYAAGLPIYLNSPGAIAGEDFTKDGNLFKSLSDKNLKGLDAKRLKSLKAIAPEILKIIKQN